MRWLVLVVGMTGVAFLAGIGVFEQGSWPYYAAAFMVYSIFQGMKKMAGEDVAAPSLETSPDPTTVDTDVVAAAPAAPAALSTVASEATAAAPDNVMPVVPPVLLPAALEAVESSSAKWWIDPRLWSAVIKAYAVFLLVATVAEYNQIWELAFQAWLPTARAAESSGAFLQPLSIALILFPFATSQAATALWLLLVAAVKPPMVPNTAVARATEVLTAAGRNKRGWRTPLICIGRVAQPVVVSVLARPILVLPRQGLDYFEHHLGDESQDAFRGVIAHEIGHLDSWDDLVFFPWAMYAACSAVLCAGLIFDLFPNHARPGSVWGHLFVLMLLAVLGFYVIRRREAYADTFSVVTLAAERPIRAALSALRAAREPAKAVWLHTHFDAGRRLALLQDRGWPFLRLSRVDFAIMLFAFLNIRDGAVASAAKGSAFWTLAMWVDALANFALLFLLLVTVGAQSLSRQGRAPSAREIAVVAAMCMTAIQLFEFISAGIYNVPHVMMLVFNVVARLLLAVPAIIIALKVLNRWAVGLLWQSDGRAQQRLVAGALGIAVAFTVTTVAMDQAMWIVGLQTFTDIEAVLNRSPSDAIATMGPMLLVVGLGWTVKLALMAAVAVWAAVAFRKARASACSACGANPHTVSGDAPLQVWCAQCGQMRRSDLLVSIGAMRNPMEPVKC